MPDANPNDAAARKAAQDKADAETKASGTAQAPTSAANAKSAAAPQPDAMITLAEAVKDIQLRMNPVTASIPTADLDKTKPGGFYVVNGVKVNAHGRELNDDGTLKHPDQQRVNEFGQLV